MIPWILLAAAQAQTVHTVPGQFGSVAEAVLAAQAMDIIEVDAAADHQRDLTEDVVLPVDLVIRGVNGRPVLPRIVVDGVFAKLESVELKGVSRLDPYWQVDPGLVASNATVELIDVDLRSPPLGEAHYGVLAVDSELELTRVTAQDFYTGPVLAVVGGSLVVTEGQFVGNFEGVVTAADSDVSIIGGSFTANWGYAGGDITVSNTSLHPLTVDGTTFSLSTGDFGGSIYAGTADVSIVGATFTDALAWQAGGAVAIYGEHAPAPVHIAQTSFTNCQAFYDGGALIVANAGDALIEETDFVGGYADSAGAARLTGGTYTLRELSFQQPAALWSGGALIVGDTEPDPVAGPIPTVATLEGVDFYGTPGAPDALVGGCLHGLDGSTLDILGGTFQDCASDLSGGAIAFAGDSLSVDLWIDPDGGFPYEIPEFKDSTSAFGGAVEAISGAVSIQYALFSDNAAAWGSAVRTVGVHTTVNHSWFTGNTATSAGTVDILDAGGMELWNNRFCGNVVQNAGAVVNATGAVGGPYKLTNNVFFANSSDLGSALRYVPADWLGNVGPQLYIENNDFVANDLSTAVLVRGQIDFTNNIVAGHPIGFVLDNAPWNNVLTGSHNLWFENGAHAQGTSAAFPGTGAVVDADPLFQGLVDGDCASNFHLQPDSPARDTGSPQLTDPDGSRSDIGAYGGPGADLFDFDGDGWMEDLDCDDEDPKVNPGAVDIPYDGVDSDCSGEDLCDGDGDGFDSTECGGTDCNDANPKIHPAARDLPNDGLDNNCDGFQPRSWMAGGGGCAADHSGGLPTLAWLVALAAIGRRRTRAGLSPATRRG